MLVFNMKTFARVIIVVFLLTTVSSTFRGKVQTLCIPLLTILNTWYCRVMGLVFGELPLERDGVINRKLERE